MIVFFRFLPAIFRYNWIFEKVKGTTARNESLEGVVTKARTVLTLCGTKRDRHIFVLFM